ncbi:terminase small subunit [Brucella sp. MAB-22]|uniref:terminase small subunit n=1 Tax=Brucella sp. MAB-22 TaxID=2986424 RepID=UPI00221EEEB5|nr:terminase small subunit [Brucella sp. MAB-22]UYT56161.1 terminase small subunit [Brucella sp. MAB-22]
MTPKQELFVSEFLVDLNGTQAAIRAGYSERTAKEQAAQMLARPEIAAAINAAMGDRAEKLELTAERVLTEISVMAFYDPAEIMLEIGKADTELSDGVSVSDDGKIYGLRGPGDVRRLPDNVRRAIVGWSWDRNGNFTVKLADKSKALDQLARHLSLYNDKLAIGGFDNLADRLMRADNRASDMRPASAPVMPEPAPKPAPVAHAGPGNADQPRHASDRPADSQKPPAPSEDWRAPAQSPVPAYRPILPAWPDDDAVGDVAADYDPLA